MVQIWNFPDYPGELTALPIIITKNILPIACTVINEISSPERFLHNSIDLLCMQQFMLYCFTQIDIMQNKCMNADMQIPET